MTTLDISSIRKNIPFLADFKFFNHAAISPLSDSVKQAILIGSDMQGIGRAIYSERVDVEYEHGKELIARLVGSDKSRISYIQNTSIGMSIISLGINFEPGDNIVIPELEFPSNVLPWIQLESKGVEIRKVSSKNGKVTAEMLFHAVDRKTKIVALSEVQYYCGYKVNLEKISSLCKKNDALFIVDGTQSVGAFDINVEECGIDVLVVAAHKWYMGPVGTGFMAFSENAFNKITPKIVGWMSVQKPFEFNRILDFNANGNRFEPGSENMVGLYGLIQRTRDIHNIGIKNIEKRINYLIEYTITHLKNKNIKLKYQYPIFERSGILLLDLGNCDSNRVYETLSHEKFITSLRSGYLRISPHYHNTTDEIDELIEILPSM